MIPRVACVGTGHWGRNLVRNFHALGALVAVSDADPAVAAAMAPPGVPVRGRAELLADPEVEAIALATPAATHASLAREALLAGKDVFVEKPLCLDLDEGASLVRLARERERVLMVGHLLRYHPAVQRLEAQVAAGVLGTLRAVASFRMAPGRIRTEEDVLWSFAPHDVSLILALAGRMPERVICTGARCLGGPLADVATCQLLFQGGLLATIHLSWLEPRKQQRMVLTGERGVAVLDDLEPETKLRLHLDPVAWEDGRPVARLGAGEPVPVPAGEPLRAECAAFLDSIRRRIPSRTDGEEALRVLSVLDAARRSMQAGGMPIRPRQQPTRGPRIHESAFIDEDVEIGDGTAIWHLCHVLPGSRIGKDCRIGQNVVIGPHGRIGDGVKIQNNVSVYEGVELEDHVFCGPSMVFTNVHNPRSEIPRMSELRRTLVRRGATLGANCTILCGITIGRYAFVGAGAVVLRDVPDFALMVGNPARQAGWICACGLRIHFEERSSRCTSCGRGYLRTDQGVEPV